MQGLAIGNGLTHPSIQYKAYPDYALNMKLINQSYYNRIIKRLPPCLLQIKICGKSLATVAFGLMNMETLFQIHLKKLLEFV